MEPNTSYELKIQRPVYQHNFINEVVTDDRVLSTKIKEISKYLQENCKFKVLLFSIFPSLLWLQDYEWKNYFFYDVIAGITVAVMNIPTGMGYGLLASLSPVVGIYTGIFPAFVYAILGTSRHSSMGSFAINAILTSEMVNMYSAPEKLNTSSSASHTQTSDASGTYTPIEVAIAVTFMVGICQLAMYVFHIGMLSSLLSRTLVSGLTAGAALQIFTSQLHELFGLHIPVYKGYFRIIKIYAYTCGNIESINKFVVLLSLITILILLVHLILFKPWLSRKTIIPAPVEIIIVLIASFISRKLNLSTNYNVRVVGYIPTGLPDIKLPQSSLIVSVTLGSFVLSLISYTLAMSVGLQSCYRNAYEMNANQELLAQGIGNLFGSLFSCMPFGASLSRSAIQENVGGKTQLATVVSCVFLITILLSIGSIFEPVPRCVLSSIIVIALNKTLLQVKDILSIWRMSKLNGMVWISTYLIVVLIGIDIGVLVGICISTITLISRTLLPSVNQLSLITGSDIYVEHNRYTNMEELQNICIVRCTGGLNFANIDYFKRQVYKLININPKKRMQKQKLLVENAMKENKYLVIDLICVQYVDPDATFGIQSLVEDFSQISVTVLFAGISLSITNTFKKCKIHKKFNLLCFPTVHDAVVYAQYNMTQHNE